MIRIDGVSLAARGLHRIDLQIGAGEVLAIAGPNGAGKSTLLALAAGELAPDEGAVLLDEVPVRRLAPSERARRVGVLPQSSALSFPFRVDEVAALGRIHRADPAIVRAALLQAGVLHLAARSYPTLSGGEKQRVHLARVLAQTWDEGRSALLLDEPTASLDPAQQHAVLEVARERARRGGAVLAVLHDLNLAARFADRVALLADGGLLCCGPPLEILTPENLARCYGIEALVLEHPIRRSPVVVAA